MEYVRQRGDFPDVPYEQIIADFRNAYPRWMAQATTEAPRDFATEA